MSRILDALATGDCGRPALAAGPEALDRGALAARAEWLARELGGENTPVAIALPNGASWIAADLALQIVNRPAVPVPPWFGPRQLAHLVRTAGIAAVISDVAPAVAHGRARHLAPALGIWPLLGEAVPLPARTAKITFTSGTTGAPKGVCLSQADMEGVARSIAHIGHEIGIRRHLCLMPLAVLLENIGGAWAALLAGAECLVPPLESIGLGGPAGIDAARLVNAVADFEPESLILVPGLLEALVDALERGARIPATLRFVAVGGAPTPVSLLSRANRLGLPVYEGYGLSECASVVTLNRPGDNVPGTVGFPLPHVRVGLAADGEIFTDGPLMLGYAGDPARPDRPWATGDLGRFDRDGRLCIVGRKRNVFITTMGRNLSPEWLEAELTADGPIRDAVVFGDGLAAPVAVLTADPAKASSVGPWVETVNRRLPGHARIARWVLVDDAFTAASALCTPNGRPIRTAIWARYGDALRAGRNQHTETKEAT